MAFFSFFVLANNLYNCNVLEGTNFEQVLSILNTELKSRHLASSKATGEKLTAWYSIALELNTNIYMKYK